MSRQQLLDAVAAQIADYRASEIKAPTAAHVDRWVSQFAADVQVPILRELSHVFDKVYVTQENVVDFLSILATNAKLTGSDPAAFWKSATLLDIQRSGNSQREMLTQFDAVLRKQVGFGREGCRGEGGVFIYIDDAIFSGTKVRYDIEPWLADAPNELTIHVVTMALHRGGEWYAGERIKARAKELKKKLTLHFWRSITLEDRKKYIDDSDLLKPTSIPDDAGVRDYVGELEAGGHPLVYRNGSSVGDYKMFSSATGRHLLEQEFLKAGVRIRAMCPNLKSTMRPLGYHYFATLGFGAMLVTHRNCPNNCPLVFWASSPWYPLFPRKINT